MMLEELSKHVAYTVLGGSDTVAQLAAERILAAAAEAITKRGRFSLVLAGGSTPQAAYRQLAAADAAWQQWHIYFGDERCLSVDDPERNSRMAFEAWLDHVLIPRHQIHLIRAEQGAATAAAEYNAVIEAELPFDLVLLGMGEDGHTASLFPGQQHPADLWAVPVYHAPKPPPERVSLTSQALSNSRALLLMVTGATKHEALQRWANGEVLPVATLHPQTPVQLLLDRDAAGL